jgi:hypothetical protein
MRRPPAPRPSSQTKLSARHSLCSIFTNLQDYNGFMLTSIDMLSKSGRKKRAELFVLNQMWQSLMNTASGMNHSYFEDSDGNLVHYYSGCGKCHTENQAWSLKIGVREWPLSDAKVAAQSVVFELSPPRAFSTWREITYKILWDIGMPNSGTHHTSNEVIATQADYPKELSLHEYMAFSTLRSRPRLQWLNIARELASPSLSFRREEVHSLITQAAWQLGPLMDGVREWHIDLGILAFRRTLLHELEALLERVQANWLEEVTVRTVGM